MTPSPRPDPEIAWRSLPAEALAGDFHDMWTGPAGIFVMIGDVSLEGVLAVELIQVATELFRSRSAAGLAPADVLAELNRDLYPVLKERGALITAQVARYSASGRMLALASAGHLWPYMMREGRCEHVALDGLPLGSLPEARILGREIRVNPGDRLVFYTDGLIECTDRSGAMFGFDRVGQVLSGVMHAPAPIMADAVMDAFRVFVGEERRRDDVSLVAVAWSQGERG